MLMCVCGIQMVYLLREVDRGGHMKAREDEKDRTREVNYANGSLLNEKLHIQFRTDHC